MLTLFGPPDRISADGRRAATSAAVIRFGTISEKTCSSRTRRAISWAYWAPKSTTRTGPAGIGGVGGQRLDRKPPLVEPVGMLPTIVVPALLSLALDDGHGRRAGRSRPRPPRSDDHSRTPFFPDDTTVNITDCVSALPRPECGSRERGGWRQGVRLRRHRRRPRRHRHPPGDRHPPARRGTTYCSR